MKFFFNLVLSFLLILVAVVTLMYANNPNLFHRQAAEMAGKRFEEVRVYEDEEDNLKYAQGACEKDSDCTPAGCSKQFCSSDPNLMTTCEVKPDFPDIFVYTCGCVKNKCSWFVE